MNKTASSGPIDGTTWPSRLPAHVVEPSDQPRVHGFDVQADLARHYAFVDLMFLAMTGEIPDGDVSRAANVALMFLAPVTIAQAPTHAAALARLCGARPSGVVAVAATALAEQARALFDAHEEFVQTLARGEVATRFLARDVVERAATQRLRDALGSFGGRIPILTHDVGLDTAIIATLVACGLTTREQIELVVTTARLPVACAEAFAWKSGDFRSYPMDLPHFEYES